MALTLEVAEGETAVASQPVPDGGLLSDSWRFGYSVTPEAVYLPVRRAGLTLSDHLEVRRVPVPSVQRVRLAPVRVSRVLLWGVVTLFAIWVVCDVGGLYWEGVGWGHLVFANLVLGAAVLLWVLGVQGRHRLSVETAPSPLAFEPGAFWATSARRKAAALGAQRGFLAACEQVGIAVVDEQA